MLRPSLCDYSDAYIFPLGTITITEGRDDATETNKRADEINKEVIFKSCVPFIECASKRRNIQIDHTKDLDIVTLVYYLIE